MATTVLDIVETPGYGVSGMRHGTKVTLGRPHKAQISNAITTELWIQSEAPFLVAFNDPLRLHVASTVAELAAMGGMTALRLPLAMPR